MNLKVDFWQTVHIHGILAKKSFNEYNAWEGAGFIKNSLRILKELAEVCSSFSIFHVSGSDIKPNKFY